ncbi:hypothetical protein B0H11DRAFT_2108884 [Mycena galericulata]|nr:hypothetical protein B0H11DRAFT_2108884 [Mycena galericulata]
MSATDEARTLIRVHAIHPDNGPTFQATAATSTSIRAAREAMHTACTNCHKIDQDLKLSRCGRCKEAWYCSKECQKKHWPGHKVFCRNVDGSGILKLVNNFLSNPILNIYLQACLILQFDLLRHHPLDPPFRAKVDIGIEPAEVPDFLDFFLGKQPSAGEMKGMVQVNAVTPLDSIAVAELPPERALVWRNAREATSAGDFPVLIEFGNGESVQTIATAIFIQPPAMQLVREARPDIRQSAITGQVTEVPFNFDTCLENINMHIRADKKDQLLLRTTLRPSDIQAIRDASANLATHSARVLRAKMARESIYTPLKISQGLVTPLPLV